MGQLQVVNLNDYSFQDICCLLVLLSLWLSLTPPLLMFELHVLRVNVNAPAASSICTSGVGPAFGRP